MAPSRHHAAPLARPPAGHAAVPAPAAPVAPAAPPAVRFLRPEPPPLTEVAVYYRLAEQSGWFANEGPCARFLATRLAGYAGGAGDEVACVPVTSCTAGLLVALRAALGEPRGGRRLVATPSFTFTATACAIRWCGFEPLFVDVEPGGWQMEPGDLERALESHRGAVAGVLGCSTFGAAAPAATLAAWSDVCAEHGLPLVIDSAAGWGSEDDLGRRLGGRGVTEVFSFHATKPFAVGEGGAVLVPAADDAERIARLANFGLEPGTRVSLETGVNAKMSELAAATGLAMADRYDRVLAARRRVGAAARERLAGLPVGLQQGSERSTMQIHQVTLPDRRRRDAALDVARELRVEARAYFDPPLHRHPAFASCPRSGGLDVTDDLASRSLSLPMANAMEDWELDRVAEVVRRAVGRARAA